MQTALRDFVVHGVATNIDFMQAVLKHDDFANGRVSTKWVEQTLKSGNLLPAVQQAAALQNLIAAALSDILFVGSKPQSAVSNETDPFSPWKSSIGYRIGENSK